MKIRDYLLDLLIKESKDIIEASQKMKAYKHGYSKEGDKGITLGEELHSELVDAIAVTMLLKIAGVEIAPMLVGDLLREDSMYIDIKYRINNILKKMKRYEGIEKEDIEEFEGKVIGFLEIAYNRLKEEERKKVREVMGIE